MYIVCLSLSSSNVNVCYFSITVCTFGFPLTHATFPGLLSCQAGGLCSCELSALLCFPRLTPSAPTFSGTRSLRVSFLSQGR